MMHISTEAPLRLRKPPLHERAQPPPEGRRHARHYHLQPNKSREPTC
jgi:hypothetical protein